MDKGLLKFLTCGSVDDGKSTLLGRLLMDAKLAPEDQIKAVQTPADLLDGLKSEREQGITIDVAWRYFATRKRKFIVADCPGHEQYTRNMATGASAADAAIILVDASKGVTEQTRRHANIVSLLYIRHIAVAVNKMDLVGWSVGRFHEIESQLKEYFGRIAPYAQLEFFPMCAKDGTNVARGEKPLLPWLEELDVSDGRASLPLRFPVNFAVRPDSQFRGFAGTVESGTVRVGDEVIALPSGKKSSVARIAAPDGDLAEALPGQTPVLVLSDELDVGSGDWLVSEKPLSSQNIRANIVWMGEKKLETGRTWLLRHGTLWTKAEVVSIEHKLDVNSLERRPASQLALNEIAQVTLATAKALHFDPYSENRATGRFILVDPMSNATMCAGMIIGVAEKPQKKEKGVIRVCGRHPERLAEKIRKALEGEEFELEIEAISSGQ